MRGVFLLVATFLFSQVALADTKIAVVDLERALFMSDAAKTARAQFEKDNKADIDALKNLEKNIRDTRQQMERDADVLSDQERSKKNADFEKMAKEYEFYSRRLQQLDQGWKRELMQAQQANLEARLRTLIENGKYEIVLQAGAAVYVSPAADITDELLESLNSKK